MRTLHAVVTLGLVIGSHSVATAIEPGAPNRLLTYDIVLAERLERSVAALPGKKSDATNAAIKAFYADRNFRPLWMTGTGLGRNAQKVVAEIARAGDYGLEADKFGLPATAGDAPRTDARAAVADELKLTRAVLKYAVYARGGRVDPRTLSAYLDRGPNLIPPADVLAAVSTHAEPDAYLRGLHPQHVEFKRLLRRYLALRRTGAKTKQVRIPKGPKLATGKRHRSVALLRERLGVPVPELEEVGGEDAQAQAAQDQPKIDLEKRRRAAIETFDEALNEAVREFQKKNGLTVDGIVGPGTRKALNGDGVDRTKRLLVNMERWRRMPTNLGKFFIWANIPDYKFYVIKDGRIIHTERIIVGKYRAQTATFSDEMEEIVFNPRWNVPYGIKKFDLLPALKRSAGALSKRGLRIRYGGRDVNPASINWSTTDINRYQIYQPSGPRNALGKLKFLFPNKHAIYMHDTPTKNLFNSTARAYSFGCVRVRDPQRFAEIILANDQGISPKMVRSKIRSGVRNSIFLKNKVPVHITYFTARADGDDDAVRYLRDPYRHDNRMSLALAGRPPAYIADHSLMRPKQAKPKVKVAKKKPQSFWVQDLFGLN